MKSLCIVFMVLSFVPARSNAQVTLLGSLRPNRGTTGGVSFAGCWGYVAPDGREYAVLGTATGCSIIDITNAAAPVEIGHIPGATSLWKEVKTYDKYAYVVSEGSQGLQIINLGNLPNSVNLDTVITSLGGFSVNTSHTISIHDGYLYLNGTNSGMIIASLANPRRPQYLGRWTTRYVHDSYVRNDTIFAAAINSGRLDIIDGRNKATPTLIASIAYTGGGTHNVWTTKDRRYAITTDEVGSTQKNLKVWNLQTLPTVSSTPVATFSPNPADIVHNVFIRGDYAYVAWYTAGLRIVNITNPTAPSDAGGYDTSTEPPGNYDGMWACYPYFPSGKIIGSDMQNGLFIFSFAGLAPRINTALIEPADQINTGTPTEIQFRWRRTSDMNKDPHYYILRIWGNGLDTTIRCSDSLFTFVTGNRLSNGTVYNWNVTTKDEFNTTLSQQTFSFTYGNSILPVVLASFSGRSLGNNMVRLDWRTLSEFQNLGFEVYRSRNNTSNYTRLPNGFIPGAGTTTVPQDYSVVDSNAATGLWYYRLRQLNQNGTGNWLEEISVQVVTSVSEEKPLAYRLEQNYPNPFNPSTKIRYSIKAHGSTTLKVFNLLGREVATLVDKRQDAGSYAVDWDAAGLPSGVYFYKLESGSFTETRKLMLVR